jgi:hypothetical protein
MMNELSLFFIFKKTKEPFLLYWRIDMGVTVVENKNIQQTPILAEFLAYVRSQVHFSPPLLLNHECWDRRIFY